MNNDETIIQINNNPVSFISTYFAGPLSLNINTIGPIVRAFMEREKDKRMIDSTQDPIIGVDRAIGRDITVRAMYAVKCFSNNWNIMWNHIPVYDQFLPVINPQIRSMWKQKKIAPIQRRIRKLQYK